MKKTKISLNKVSLSFEKKCLFDDLEFNMTRGDKITIVGENGCGKTTFLRLLSGVDYPYSGSMLTEGRIGYLPQNFEEIEGDLPAIIVLLKNTQDSEIQNFLKDQTYKPLSSEWFKELNLLGGHQIFEEANLIGLADHLLEKPFKQLSGGEKTKTMLCALKIMNPDIILLDEPTNHLDSQGIEWLEDFLKEYDGGVVMVTHDRSLIIAVSNQISELSPHTKKFVSFKGGYDNYLVQEEKKRQRAIQERQHQDKELKVLKQKAIQIKSKTKDRKIREGCDRDKLSYNNKEQRVQDGRTKAFNQFNRKQDLITDNLVDVVDERVKISFDFNDELTSKSLSSLRIEVSNISKSFEEVLFHDVSFTLKSGDRLIIQGANGSGKSTLMRIIMKLAQADEGTINISNGAIVGYLDQEQETMDLEKSAIELLMEDEMIKASKKQAINNLCNFGIHEWQDLNSPLKTLSIGCRRKAQLCQIIMKNSTILLLDEPTNHIDFPSLEVIEEALIGFPGIIIAATHDRYFSEKVGTKILNLSEYKE